MNIRWVSVPRDGSAPQENEDAVAIREVDGVLRAAVADGATESVYSRQWAISLAEAFADTGSTDAAVFLQRLPVWAEQWRSRLPRGRVPWYVDRRIDEGAHAALLGITIDGRTLRAISVGDCCLFHLTANDVVTWPMESVAEFGHRPSLVATSDLPPVVIEWGTRLEAGQAVMLATDAVAAWLFDAGPSDVRAPDADLEALIIDARRRGTLRNDDATLIIIEVA